MTETNDQSSPAWDAQIASLLAELSTTQTDLLALLSRKRGLIADRDTSKLAELEPEEAQLSQRLRECQQQRQSLLRSAAAEGLPSENLRALTAALPRAQRDRVSGQVEDARRTARLVQHQSLTNWVLVQRSLLHLSQMIEIIATGGQGKPTYGDDGASSAGGVIVDRAV